jgi:transposase
MEQRKLRRFDKAFKLSAVKMVTEAGHSVAEVARSLDVNVNVLYNWKKKYANDGDKAFVGTGHLTELSALRKQLREVTMERDILKKAVGIFSKEDQNGSGL